MNRNKSGLISGVKMAGFLPVPKPDLTSGANQVLQISTVSVSETLTIAYSMMTSMRLPTTIMKSSVFHGSMK